MNAAELIAELQKWPPGCPVRVLTRSAFTRDENGESMVDLCEEDAQEADEVRPGGGYVLIWGGRP